MSLARTQQLADAFVSHLNSKRWGEGEGIQLFAKRSYFVLSNIVDIRAWGEEMRTRVVCRDESLAKLSRRDWEMRPTIDVGFQRKPRNTENEWIDPLVRIVEQVRDEMADQGGAFAASLRAIGYGINSAVIDPICAWEHIVEMKLFTSVVSFKLIRILSL